MNIFLSVSTEAWIQAYWYKRFSEDTNNPLVIKALRQCIHAEPCSELLVALKVTKEPVFITDTNRNVNLVGIWNNKGPIPRPKNERFLKDSILKLINLICGLINVYEHPSI